MSTPGGSDDAAEQHQPLGGGLVLYFFSGRNNRQKKSFSRARPRPRARKVGGAATPGACPRRFLAADERSSRGVRRNAARNSPGKVALISVGGSDVTAACKRVAEPESYFYLKSRPRPSRNLRKHVHLRLML